MSKEENIRILLKNFVESQNDIEIAFVYSNQGLLISKYGRLEKDAINEEKIDEIYGALTSLVEKLLEKISLEYKIGHYGSGSFETSDHRIVYLEAGPDAILLLVCNYLINLNNLFPIAFLVVEKITQLLEDSFDFNFNTLEIPDLKMQENISVSLNKFALDQSNGETIGIKPIHHIKKEKKIEQQFKLIILGSAAVGKTTLVNRFLKKDQKLDLRPTIGISISTQNYHFQGFKEDIIKFLIYDLAGQDFFKRVRHDYYIAANCAFIVYDVTRKNTFEEAVNFWFKDARQELGDIPFILIGNKTDLEESREVSREEGLEMAQTLKTSFIETSALHNINVQDTFKIVGIGLLFKYIEKDR
ncbi:MAG: GTP-binding protein [Candidatus Hodarchaeota archaeon]